MTSFIKITQSNKIAIVTLNRADKRNAMHGPLISELSLALTTLAQSETRVLILNGAGEDFCAGGDIAWMQHMINASQDQNEADAKQLAELLLQLYHFPVPTIVLAQGKTFGGGMGLVTASDIALANKDAVFGFPEVKIGMTPAVISPYVIAAIGVRQASYYFLTGESFKAEEAKSIGVIHRIIDHQPLLDAGLALANTLLVNGPYALSGVKKLIPDVARQKISSELAMTTAEHLAERRVSQEGQEGLRAFLEKRPAKW